MTPNVGDAYDKVANEYAEGRNTFDNTAYLEKFDALLPRGATILDAGCGAGVPVDKFLVERGHNVSGIDISKAQIELAKKSVPKATYEVKDMLVLKPGEYSLDGIVSFYAVFHTPRTEQKSLFEKFYSFLKPGGIALVTMGTSETDGEEDFLGTRMYFSSYAPEKNVEMLAASGFEILMNEIDDMGGDRNQIILARKK